MSETSSPQHEEATRFKASPSRFPRRWPAHLERPPTEVPRHPETKPGDDEESREAGVDPEAMEKTDRQAMERELKQVKKNLVTEIHFRGKCERLLQEKPQISQDLESLKADIVQYVPDTNPDEVATVVSKTKTLVDSFLKSSDHAKRELDRLSKEAAREGKIGSSDPATFLETANPYDASPIFGYLSNENLEGLQGAIDEFEQVNREVLLTIIKEKAAEKREKKKVEKAQEVQQLLVRMNNEFPKAMKEVRSSYREAARAGKRRFVGSEAVGKRLARLERLQKPEAFLTAEIMSEADRLMKGLEPALVKLDQQARRTKEAKVEKVRKQALQTEKQKVQDLVKEITDNMAAVKFKNETRRTGPYAKGNVLGRLTERLRQPPLSLDAIKGDLSSIQKDLRAAETKQEVRALLRAAKKVDVEARRRYRYHR